MDSSEFWQLLSISLVQGHVLSQAARSALGTICQRHWRRCLGACTEPDAVRTILAASVAQAEDMRHDILLVLLETWCLLLALCLEKVFSMCCLDRFHCRLRQSDMCLQLACQWAG